MGFRTTSWAVAALSLLAGLAQAQRARAADGNVREIEVPGHSARARAWEAPGPDGRVVPFTSVSVDGQHFSAPRPTDYELRLRHGRFDPLGEAENARAIAPELRAGAANHLFVVQYWTQGLEDYRAVVRALGGEIHLFLANHANVVELDTQELAAVRALPFVRAVVPYHPAYKLSEDLRAALAAGRGESVRVNLLTMRRGGQAPVGAWIEAHGGKVIDVSAPTYLMTVEIPFAQMPGLAALDTVQWMDRWSAPGNDMDIARAFHGANAVESALGITGDGVRVEVMDVGCNTAHPDLPNFLVHNGNTFGSHGTCTSGIVLGTGSGNAQARGCMPDAFLVVADYELPFAGGSRYTHSAELVNPGLPYQCVLQSNSWGGGLTTAYDALSQDMDLILFDLQHLSICQSQSNAGSQSSRPQAWAKNIISVGGVNHQNTLTPADDVWGFGGSIGPAADGRIKPDIASFYDNILCTDQLGGLGYASGNYFSGFGGTSGATPIVAGHLGLIYEMWHRGDFGNPTPGATVFENACNNTTAKALLINSAQQWDFSGTAHDLTRMHQGWGHPSLQNLLAALPLITVVDESDLLTELGQNDYAISVAPGQARLHATLVYRDPPGTTSTTVHRINDLDLTLTSPSSTIYHGNVGLDASIYSNAGGVADARNTVENVIIKTPTSGTWTIRVSAPELNQDSHVETPGQDADYALVVYGGTLVPTSAPNAPSDLVARGGGRRIRLTYTDNSNNESGFEIERSPDGVAFLPLTTLVANEHEHVDTGLAPDTTYYYRVRAVNLVGPSAWSATASATTSKLVTSGNP